MHTKLNLHRDPSITLIRSYTEGTFQIGEQQYAHSIIVTPQRIMKWDLSSINALQDEDFAVIFEKHLKPELIILGTGAQLHFPAAAQTRSLIDAQIGIEIMDTAAACRTYNILADDGRKAVACLIA